jgi:hypothetical protein
MKWSESLSLLGYAADYMEEEAVNLAIKSDSSASKRKIY